MRATVPAIALLVILKHNDPYAMLAIVSVVGLVGVMAATFSYVRWSVQRVARYQEQVHHRRRHLEWYYDSTDDVESLTFGVCEDLASQWGTDCYLRCGICRSPANKAVYSQWNGHRAVLILCERCQIEASEYHAVLARWIADRRNTD